MGLHFDLAYGTGTLPLDLPDGLEPVVLVANEQPALPDAVQAVRDGLKNPIGAEPLVKQLKDKKPEKIVVVVNDETRPTPYYAFFPPLVEAFEEAGIRDEQVTFVIATGIHDPHSKELNEKTYGKHMTDRFKFVSHIAKDDDSLVHMGRFDSGYEFYVNKLAVEADFLITVGVVMPHYFAGFSGGRKSILPGLAGFRTVEQNHARMVELMDNLPPIRQNPVSLEMIEAARMVGVNFIINAVTGSNKEVVKIVAGDLVAAWYEAVETSSSMFEIPFEKQVDICVSSACGYPRDVNMYQAQKALDHADRITRDGGTIILVTESPSGYGEDVFERWMREGMTPQQIMDRIRTNFVMGGHKAYGFAKVAANKKFILVSSLSAEDSLPLFATKAESVQAAFDAALAENPGATVAVLPQGSLTLPVQATA
ncbi:MAG: nickel-dependent lactate racemase [Mailhella sp.]|nr:nickel-dependent lactate racemase [Mailhella sp.]